jgi:TolB-like protein
MSFFQELKRRNVFRVAVAYIIVAWLLLQVGDTLGPALRLPEWFQSGVAYVLILGFPIAIIFAWAFELTPDGVKREKHVDRTESITHETGQKLNYTIIGLLIAALAYFALDKFVFEHDHEVIETHAGEPSIAVLPFANMSDDASNEFFADGITEELLNLLAKIPELEVTSRTSAFQFKGKEIDIPTVARLLGVDHVLEGSVRKSGIKVRITAQLIDAGTDKHVWSETYDRELDDIFAIQDEIARKVVDELHVTLLGAAPKARETDPAAYALYLEGLHYLDVNTPESWPRAMELFERVIDVDPNYAPAWYGKARATRAMANFGLLELDEATALARRWAEHALELDPELADAWALIARMALIYDWDWAAARELIDRALEVGPTNSNVLEVAARYHQALGLVDEMLVYAERALGQDPLSKVRLEYAGDAHVYARNWDRALELYRKNEAIHGQDAWPGDALVPLMMQGRYDEVAEQTDALAARDDEIYFQIVSAYTLYPAGRRAEAAAGLDWVIENLGTAFSYQIAQIFTIQENPDKAFEWLETGYATRDGGMPYLLVDPFLEPLHDDPRWRPLLEKMNLLEYWDAMPGR